MTINKQKQQNKQKKLRKKFFCIKNSIYLLSRHVVLTFEFPPLFSFPSAFLEIKRVTIDGQILNETFCNYFHYHSVKLSYEVSST